MITWSEIAVVQLIVIIFRIIHFPGVSWWLVLLPILIYTTYRFILRYKKE